MRATKLVSGLRKKVSRRDLPTLKYRRIRGNMIEVYKLLMSKYDDDIVHLDMNIDTRTRGHTKKHFVNRCHHDVRKYSFCIRVVNIWNSLPNEVITATSVNNFENRLDIFWADQEVLYNYNANITRNRGIKL